MSTAIRIGIDVGGTNTDAAALDGRNVIASVKRPTTADVTGGIQNALAALLHQARIVPTQVRAVMIGTTHFVNAVVQRKDLTRVAALRLCGPATRSLPPMVDWPDDLRECVCGPVAYVDGGAEFDGSDLLPFDEATLRRAVREAAEHGVTSFALAGVFSPVNHAHEARAEVIIGEMLPSAIATCSHDVGKLGFHERENATLLNACLCELGHKTITSFKRALADSGLQCPLYLTQNDGTLMAAETTERFPVFTFASGPTNSMRGAAFLSGIKDGIVIDIGGTSTDVGALVNGFPREASVEVEVGGVRTNFRMPDVHSFGLGGGSLVTFTPVKGEGSGIGSVGPQSVGYELTRKALIFGGETLTATDIAVAGKRMELGDACRVAHLNAAFVQQVLSWVQSRIEEAIDHVKLSRGDVPVILVGGGSALLGDTLAGASAVIRPPHYQAANAVGAAISQSSGMVDKVVSLTRISRDQAIEQAKREAMDKAIAAGADRNTLKIVDVEDLPLAYLPSNATRIRVKAVGDVSV